MAESASLLREVSPQKGHPPRVRIPPISAIAPASPLRFVDVLRLLMAGRNHSR